MRYELKLDNGKVVTWDGADPEDASRRYVDARRIAGEAVSVVAWRNVSAQGTVTVLGRGTIDG